MLKTYTQTSKRAMSEREQITRSFAPMVYRVVRHVAARLPLSIDRESLFSAGMLGLLDAHAKFDGNRGIRFEAYARIRVKGAILDELRGLDHLTRGARRRTRAVQQSHEHLTQSEGASASDAAVAADTGLSLEEVQHARVQHMGPEAIDEAIESTNDRSLWEEPSSALDDLVSRERVRLVAAAIASLPERNRLVVGLYYEGELTLREIGDILGVTESRISQILGQSIKLVRETLAAEQN